MAKDFMKRLLASSNVAYIQALQSISVSLQSTRAHSISVPHEFLTLDAPPPTLPYTAGPLPQVPPPSVPARPIIIIMDYWDVPIKYFRMTSPFSSELA